MLDPRLLIVRGRQAGNRIIGLEDIGLQEALFLRVEAEMGDKQVAQYLAGAIELCRQDGRQPFLLAAIARWEEEIAERHLLGAEEAQRIDREAAHAHFAI